MGFLPKDNAGSMDQEEAAFHDLVRPLITGPFLSKRELHANKLHEGGYFVEWVESDQRFAFFLSWSNKLKQPVIVLHGHSPFHDNREFGSCNQYFWVPDAYFEAQFRII